MSIHAFGAFGIDQGQRGGEHFGLGGDIIHPKSDEVRVVELILAKELLKRPFHTSGFSPIQRLPQVEAVNG